MRRYQLEHEIMIIRRLAAAIKNQDWFTVFIEFVIVVAGIFVGLQVNDWNENRLNRAQERANLARLLDEAENSLAYIEGMVEGVTIIIGAQRQLLEIMSSDGPLPIDTTTAEFGFESLNWFQAITPPRAVYDELEATGGLKLIRSNAIRESVSVYYAVLDNFTAQLSYFRSASISAGADQFFAARDYVRAEYDPSNNYGRRFVFDWPGLRSDAYLESLFVTKLRNQIAMNDNRQELLSRALIMCQTIAKEINSECVPPGSIEDAGSEQ